VYAAHDEAAFGHAHGVGGDHAEPGDLRDGQVDEDDAAVQHLHAQGDVGGEHQQPGDERRPQDAPVERAPVHRVPPAATSRATVSSKRPKRSFAASLPPTVNGIFTAAMPAFLLSHSDARESW